MFCYNIIVMIDLSQGLFLIPVFVNGGQADVTAAEVLGLSGVYPHCVWHFCRVLKRISADITEFLRRPVSFFGLAAESPAESRNCTAIPAACLSCALKFFTLSGGNLNG